MKTITDLIREIEHRTAGRTHWEGCEKEHVDCATLLALRQFRHLAMAADQVVYCRVGDRDENIQKLRTAMNEVYAVWLLPLANSKA